MITLSPNDNGIRAERWIEKTYPQVPRSMRQKFFRTKKIAFFREGKRLKLEKSLTLKTGDEIKIFFRPEEFGEKKEEQKVRNFDAILKHPKLSQVKTVWEDDFLMIVEKPAGVAVHPGSGVRFGHSLIDYCVALVQSKNPNAPEPKLVHRLDKDTSGLVMVAKSDSFLRKILKVMNSGGIEKKYFALVHGSLKKKKGTITEKIERTEGSKYNKISINNEKGKDSVTHYEVKKYSPEHNISLVDVLLETGRMHQIRIHFASNGHPLAGDPVYGKFSWNKELQKKYRLKRQALHAYSLQFIHPETKKNIVVQSDFPVELLDVMNS